MARYRVDNVPWFLWPLYALFGYGLGLVSFLLMRALSSLSRISVVGEELGSPEPHIVCAWHENVVLYFVAVRRWKSQVWLNHPAWYMKPVHVTMRLFGVRDIILGSTGHDGRAAAEALCVELSRGASTTVFPDGPAGPPKRLHRGVLHLAAQTGLPILPLRFSCRPAVRARTWDQKLFPLPFSRIEVSCQPLLRVGADLDEARRALEAALG